MHHLIDTLARDRRAADRAWADDDRRARAVRRATGRATISRWIRTWR